MKSARKKAILFVCILAFTGASIVSLKALDERLIRIHQKFLYCQLITLDMSPDEAMKMVGRIRSSEYIFNNRLNILEIDFRDKTIRHLFGGPSRLFYINGKYEGASIEVSGSTWQSIHCEENP